MRAPSHPASPGEGTSAAGREAPPRAGWAQPLLILVVVILGYGIAPGRLPLIGEEATRAQHGIEMAASGDWLIPTVQGVAIIDRPPLQYWLLALVHRFVHPLDPLTLRMTMLVLTFLTGLTVWLYARRIFAPAGALVAGLAYPTMGHVFDLGRRVETDGLFTLLTAGALLVWHHGYRERWPPAATWAAGCGVAALATLTKGTQGPIVFYGTVGLFLVLRGEWRSLVGRAHACGLSLLAGLVAVWLVPFQLRAGRDGARMTWIDPFTRRVDSDPLQLVRQLVGFPFEILVACLPWSVLLLGLLHRNLWRARDELRSSLVFVLLGIFVIFAPVWISADGKPRYAMPLYPLVAVACGAVADRCRERDAPAGLRRLWRGTLAGTAGLLALGSLGLAAVRLSGAPGASEALARLRQPWWLIALLFGASSAVVILACRRRVRARSPRVAIEAVALAVVVAIAFGGPVLDASAWNTDRLEQEMAELRRRLPPEARLVSFGRLHRKFVYWYAEPIPILADEQRSRPPADLEYFAIDVEGGAPAALSFPFEELARLDMDPKREPSVHVLVGRRLPAAGVPRRD